MATHNIIRTALYARISTSNNGQSPEMQLRELREYCERRPGLSPGSTLTRDSAERKIAGQSQTG
jgi:hypothetical protein